MAADTPDTDKVMDLDRQLATLDASADAPISLPLFLHWKESMKELYSKVPSMDANGKPTESPSLKQIQTDIDNAELVLRSVVFDVSAGRRSLLAQLRDSGTHVEFAESIITEPQTAALLVAATGVSYPTDKVKPLRNYVKSFVREWQKNDRPIAQVGGYRAVWSDRGEFLLSRKHLQHMPSEQAREDARTAFKEILEEFIKQCDRKAPTEDGDNTVNALNGLLVLGAAWACPFFDQLTTTTLRGALWHMWGNSGKGKTVFIDLIHSLWAADVRSTWDTTVAGLTSALAESHLIPYCMDEGGRIDEDKLSEMIFSIGDGTERTRSTTSGRAKEKKSWRTMVFSSGESQLETASGADGETRRIINIPMPVADLHTNSVIMGYLARNHRLFPVPTADMRTRMILMYRKFHTILSETYASRSSSKARGVTEARIAMASMACAGVNLMFEFAGVLPPSIGALVDHVGAHIRDVAEETESRLETRVWDIFSAFLDAHSAQWNFDASSDPQSPHTWFGVFHERNTPYRFRRNIKNDTLSLDKTSFQLWLESTGNQKNLSNLVKNWSRDGLVTVSPGRRWHAVKLDGVTVDCLTVNIRRLGVGTSSDGTV
jgi:hypothetical protein